MHTEIRQVDTSYHVLEITATAADLADDVKRALKELKGTVEMKGFRPGHVPPALLKVVFRKELTEQVSEKFIDEVFTDLVAEADQYLLEGTYVVRSLDYTLEQDLAAEVAFNVVPDIDLSKLEQEAIAVHQDKVLPQQIDAEYWRRMKSESSRVTLKAGERISALDDVLCSIHSVDAKTGLRLVGGYAKTVEIDLCAASPDNRFNSEIKRAIVGRYVKDTVQIEVEDEGLPSLASVVMTVPQTPTYSVEILEAEQTVLPEPSEELFRSLSGDRCGTEKEFRQYLGERIQDDLDADTAKYLRDRVFVRMMELFPFKVAVAHAESTADPSPGTRETMDELFIRWSIIVRAVDKQIPTEGDAEDAEADQEKVTLAFRDRQMNRVLDFLVGRCISASKSLVLPGDYTLLHQG